MLRSDLCDYSDPYIAVEGTITVEGANNSDRKKNRSLTFKNNAPFSSCISKINGVINRKYIRFRNCNAYVQFNSIQ